MAAWKQGLVLVLILVGLGGISLALAGATQAAVDPTQSSCTAATSPTISEVTATAAKLSPADQRTNAPPAINFDQPSGAIQLAPYTYNVATSDPNTSGTIDTRRIAWELSLVNGNASFPDGHIAPVFKSTLNGFEVHLCISAVGVNPGSYSGSFGFGGGGVKPVQLPLTVNVRYGGFSAFFWIYFGMLIAALIGVFIKWWMTLIAKPNASTAPDLGQYFAWLGHQTITIVIAVVGAGFAVFQNKYWESNGFTSQNLLSLWIAVGVAVAASALLTTTIGQAVQNKPTKEPDGQASV
jgi:hypothetical protein